MNEKEIDPTIDGPLVEDRKDRIPFQDDDDYEPAGTQKIERHRPHRPPRERHNKPRRQRADKW